MIYHTSMTILNETATIRVKQDFMDLVTDELSKLESNILDFSDLIQHNKELSRFDFWTSLFFSATVFTTVGRWAVVAATRTFTQCFCLFDPPPLQAPSNANDVG